jgi:hypothetical protein
MANCENRPVAPDFALFNKSGQLITSVDEWWRLAPPKSQIHWKDNRSAKELAKSWFRDGTLSPPEELTEVLRSNSAITPLCLERGVVEYPSAFDSVKGECANIDLMLYGRSAVIAIEAKADEPFAATVEKTLRAARGRTRTNFPKRLAAVVDALFSTSPDTLDGMGYQLLSGTAGVLARLAGRSLIPLLLSSTNSSLVCARKINLRLIGSSLNCSRTASG